MNDFEKHIAVIDTEISIQKEDRAVYTKDFDAIRDFLLGAMKKEDGVFEKVFAGQSLFGSYTENLRIGKPDEFDLHFLLKLPFYNEMKIEKDMDRPGYIRLSITKVLARMKADPNLKDVYDTFASFVGVNNYIKRLSLNCWLEGIIERALKIHGNKVITSPGTFYELQYMKRGTAHTFKARSSKSDRYISIDFVPAFKFDGNQKWFADRSFPENVKEKLWFAVPKPTPGRRTGNEYTFSICAPQIEKHLLENKYNLKSSMRLLKCLRDKMPSANLLKSYFIRSVYLLENDRQAIIFWQKSAGFLLLHMVGRLLNYIESGSIPFYWDSGLNLLNNLDKDEIIALKKDLYNAKMSLESLYNQRDVKKEAVEELFAEDRKLLKLSKERA